jgi:uncharacterized membrane protein YphA (DoxX/SURF4 family)
MQTGRRVFVTAAAALGAIGLFWGDFAANWQPIPPDLPARAALASLAGALLLVAGLAAHRDGMARVAGWILAAVFGAFSVPWAVRVVRFPEIFGTWGGFAEAFSLVLASILVAQGYGRPQPDRGNVVEYPCIIAFGFCAIAFGLNHFFALPQTAAMVPGWILPSRMFWAVATGIFHCAAGLAIVSGLCALLAARLLGGMMLGFSALVWIPNLIRSPAVHMSWAGNAENLALAGAAFVVADAIARRRRHDAEPISFRTRADEDVSPGPYAAEIQR